MPIQNFKLDKLKFAGFMLFVAAGNLFETLAAVTLQKLHVW